jgi:diguanylate cyclase (GGDEF)-like protein/PAS domain S-box-containing protein
MKQYTIRQYVAWLTLIPLLIMAASLETYFLHDRSADLDHDLIEHGRLIARQFASSSEYGVFSNNQPFLKNIAQSVLHQPDVRGAIILNAASDGLIEVGEFSSGAGNTKAEITQISLGTSLGQNPSGRPSQIKPMNASKVKDRVNLLTPILSDGESLWIYQPIISAQVPLDEFEASPAARQVGAVIVEMSWARTNKLKSQMFWWTVGATALFLMVSLYLIYLAGRSITLPIRKLSDAVKMIGEGNLEMCVSVPTRIVELSNLVQGINAMTAQLQQESAILHQRMEEATRIAAIAFESHEGMMVTDVNGVILRVNSAFTKITGYTGEEAVGQMARLLKSDRHDANFYAAMWKSIHHLGSWQGEIWNLRKNGESYPAWLTITAVERGDGVVTYYVATLSDITVRKAAENEIKNMAFYDTLTQLPNRRLLMDRLSQAIAANKRSGRYGALMFLDLDNFKPLNDKYGHVVGDLLLIEVARRLTSCVREADTIARFGGDEFVVMLSELDVEKAEPTIQAGIVAEKIRLALAEPYTLEIQQEDQAPTIVNHHCTSSIGVVLFDNQEAGPEDVLKCADMAMYKAKRDGRNLIRFYE